MIERSPPRFAPVCVGAAVALLVGLPLVLVLASGVVEPVDLLLPGQHGPSAALIRRDFPGATFRNDVGFDGQQYYAIARFFPHLDRAARYLDDPQIRSQRVLQPAIGSLGPQGNGIVYAFLASGLLGIALAAAALADILGRHGCPTSWAWVAGAALFVPVLLSTPEPLAYGLGFAGCALASRQRPGAATTAFVAGALARESALLFAIPGAVELARGRRHLASALCVLFPAAAFATWQVTVRHALGELSRPYASQLQLLGFLRADPVNRSLAITTLVLGAWAAWRWRTVPVLSMVSALFAVSVLGLAPRNLGPLALVRTMAPVATAVLAAVVQEWAARATPSSQREPRPTP